MSDFEWPCRACNGVGQFVGITKQTCLNCKGTGIDPDEDAISRFPAPTDSKEG